MEMNGAREILSTYRDVHDTHSAEDGSKTFRSKLQQKNKNLESELNSLKEKYIILQRELINKDKKLETLNNELIDKTIYMTRLQEDFENAIEQLKRGVRS